MSNAARLTIPGGTNDGAVPTYNSATDTWDFALPLLGPEFFNVRKSSLARWRTALAGARAASRGPARILWLGDSDAEGYSPDIPAGQNERNTRPSVRLIDALNGTLVPYDKVFDGIMGFNNGITPSYYDGLWVPGATFGPLAYAASWGLTGLYNANAAGGAPVSTSTYGPFNADGFKVWHLTSNNVTNPTYAVGYDGGATTDVNATAGTFIGTIQSATVTAASYGSHTLNVVSKTVTSAYLLAVEVTRLAANGLISVGSAGMGASSTVEWADNSNPGATPRDCITATAPDLVIIGLSGNDQGNGLSAVSFEANMRLIVAACQLSGDVITLSAPADGLPNPQLRFAYRDAFRNIANSLGTTHIDLGVRWGESVEAADIGGLYATDGIHATKYGYADMAKAVATILMAVDT